MPASSRGSAGDQSAKYTGVLKLLDTGSLAKPTPDVVTRYDAAGKVTPNGQFEVSLDSGKTAVCITDTARGHEY